MKKKKPTFLYVYIITNKVLNKQYIGSRMCYTNTIEDDDYWGSSKFLKKDYELLGKENFSKEILQFNYLNKTDLLNGETEYILKYNTLIPNGYNMFLPNKYNGFHMGGRHQSEETKNKIRIANTGKKRTEETKQKLRGKKTEEHKLNMQLNRANQKGSNNNMHGKSVYSIWLQKFGEIEAKMKMKKSYKPLSEERKQKISNSLKGKKTGMESNLSGNQYKKWVEKFGEEIAMQKEQNRRIKISISIKDKIENIKKGILNQKKYICPICKKQMYKGNFVKYKHGPNCKGNLNIKI